MRAEVARALELLRPPCWHNWGSGWPAPNDSGHYPQIWNPNTAADVDLYQAWNQAALEPGQWWLIGNEPLMGDTRAAWCSVELMAQQARTFEAATGEGYVLCGKCPDEAGFAYCRELLRLGCSPVAWHWHIYPWDVAGWRKTVEECMQFDPRRPVIISETGIPGGDVAAQRALMDCILETLATFAEVHAVMWFVSYDPTAPGVLNLLDGPGAGAGLTATGRHYAGLSGG